MNKVCLCHGVMISHNIVYTVCHGVIISHNIVYTVCHIVRDIRIQVTLGDVLISVTWSKVDTRSQYCVPVEFMVLGNKHLTHWGINKRPIFCRRHFQMHFTGFELWKSLVTLRSYAQGCVLCCLLLRSRLGLLHWHCDYHTFLRNTVNRPLASTSKQRSGHHRARVRFEKGPARLWTEQ